MDDSGIRYLLSELGADKIKRSGQGVLATCPLAQWTHSEGRDSRPSFSMKVNESGESPWMCFSCQNKGTAKGLIYKYKEFSGEFRRDLLDLIREQQDGSLENRIKKLGDWDNWSEDSYALNGDSWYIEDYEGDFDIKNFKDVLRSIPKYAVERGITLEQAMKWKIGYHKEMKRLFFTILDEEMDMVGWSGRAIYDYQDPKYFHAEGMKRDKYLYGECFVDRTIRTGYLSEGFMDVLSLDRMGLKNCLGTMGTSCSGHHVEKIKKWFDRVIIFPHNDRPGPNGKAAGMMMAENYHKAITDAGVVSVISPVVDGKKDPGEWDKKDLSWALETIRRQGYEWSGR